MTAVRVDGAALQLFETLEIAAGFRDQASFRSGGDRGAIVPRSILARLLADTAIALGAEVRLGTTIRAWRQDADGVDVDYSDARRARYDLLIAADGVFSRMRNTILRRAPRPVYSGETILGAYLPSSGGLQGVASWFDQGVDIGLHPVSANLSYLSVRTALSGKTSAAEALPALREILARSALPAVQALASRLDDAGQTSLCPLYRLALPSPWHKGRALLVGGAVRGNITRHGFLSQGGMQDAVVLAQEIASAERLEAALDAYACQRWNAAPIHSGAAPPEPAAA
jgi:2-polyprenyl-6-methoxyphenol hydroxylase-like FAD-dependent oxidoreductase